MGSLSALSPLHAAEISTPPNAAAVKSEWNTRELRPGRWEGMSVTGLRVIRLEAPRQSLQICDCDPVPDLTIVISIARLRECVLGVHNFQHRRFPRLVAEIGQAETVGRHLCGTGQ